MPRRASLLLLAAALLTVVIIFLAVECPDRRPITRRLSRRNLGPALEEAVFPSRRGRLVRPSLQGRQRASGTSRSSCPWNSYAALEPALEEAIRAASGARGPKRSRNAATARSASFGTCGAGRKTLRPGPSFSSSAPKSRPRGRRRGRIPRPGPMAAIIIDDVGYNLDIVRALGALGRPLTLAVLPACPHTRGFRPGRPAPRDWR